MKKDKMPLGRKIKIGLMTAVVSLAGWGSLLNENNKVGLEKHMKEITPIVMQEQEKEFGIKYDEKPKLDLMQVGLEQRKYFAGAYKPEKDKIFLDPFLNTYPASDLEKKLGRGNEKGGIIETKEVMEHEMGHFYADKRSEQLNKRNFPQVKKYKGIDTRLNFIKSSLYEEDTELSIKQLKKNHKKLFTEKFVERVLTEGIAEYFQYKGQKDPNFIDSAWPETILDFENSLEEEKAIYEGGYSIVKPILDEFGVQNGVDYIVTHVPEIKQLSEFPTYRDKAMQELGGIK